MNKSLKIPQTLGCLAIGVLLLAAGSASAVVGSGSATASTDTRDYTLTVTSAQGTPTPAAGLHPYAWRSVVTCAAGSSAGYTCTGWTGTGSVPASSGALTTGELTLDTVSSSITWNWRADTRILRLDGTLAFGNVVAGTSTTQPLTLHNDGNVALTVTDLAFPAGFSGDWTAGAVAAGGSQAVTVSFSPVAAQAYGGDLAVASDATSGGNTLPCSGAGIVRVLRLDGAFAFGNVVVGSSATRALTLHNDGNVPLTVTDIAFPAGFSGDWTAGAVAAGGSQAVTVTFAPVAAQAYGGDLAVASDATSGANAFPCSGMGIVRVLRLDGTLSFGNVAVGGSATRSLAVHNDGNTALTVTDIAFPAGFSGDWTAGAVAAGGSQAISVTFQPLAVQAYGGDIVVTSDATEGADSMACSGTGFVLWPSDGLVLDDRTPTFAWASTPGATWYRLWISLNGVTYQSLWVAQVTTWTPASELPAGNYLWWVQPWGPQMGYGAWSQPAAFSLLAHLPAALVQIAPSGAQVANDLTYRWQNDANATWYHLWVGRTGGATWRDQWYPSSGLAETAVAIGGHPTGSFTWWVQGWGRDGLGPWTGPMEFSTPSADPAKPILTAPNGPTGDRFPVFLWQAAPRATWYRVYVSRGSGMVIDQWTQDTRLPSPVSLADGAHSWWVGSWNDAAQVTVWSERMDFSVP